jgi:SAM-dependent methyltransferase
MTERVPTTNFSTGWTQVDRTSDPSFYTGLLDATRAQDLDQARQEPAAVLAPLQLRPGLRVLDIGCGTGDYLRIVAPLVAPGRAVGIDLSETLVAQARRRAGPAEPNVSFQVGDAYDLPVPDATVDRAIATQILLHLADPWRAAAEFRRVLAPGGRLAISEWDWDSTCLAVTDRDLGRRFVHLLCDRMRNGLIVRDLPFHLTRLGFAQIAVTPRVQMSREPGPAQEWLIEPAAQELVRTGALTADEGRRLLDDLRERAAEGRYFLARTYYTVIAAVD